MLQMFILDTNVISELRRPELAHPNVLGWAQGLKGAVAFISVMTLLELEIGVRRKERQDPAQGAKLRAWLDDTVKREFADRILPVDERVAMECAPMHVPSPASERDSLIAATALVHRLTVVTRNVADFAMPRVAVLNPWDANPVPR